MGKVYVLNEDYFIVCIGVVNVDCKFYVYKDLVVEILNFVMLICFIGGVVRNIVENLGRFGEMVVFLFVSG